MTASLPRFSTLRLETDMKALAALLRKMADKLDPPSPDGGGGPPPVK